MATNRLRRIAKEIDETASDTFSKVILRPAGDSDDISHLEGSFQGPPETPYEGGTFKIDIIIPSEYPFRPPKMKFKTKIWHPNVSSVTGAICLDTLSTNWSPVLTIKSALISIQGLLASPEPKDPQDHEVASMLLKSPDEFAYIAREWAVKHAGAPERDDGESSSVEVSEEMARDRVEGRTKRASGAGADSSGDEAALERYHGYSPVLVGRFCAMGFDVDAVVAAFEHVGIDKNGGEDYELEEEYMGDITARLFGEP